MTTASISHARAIRWWLLLCMALVACMVLLGGYTRLSGSGLSITEWKPIHGTVPPLSLSEWEEEFAGYRETPQYKQVNAGMTLEEFKTIYWPEYYHRLLGRAIGVVFLFPFLYFLARRAIDAPFAVELFGLFALGGLQGFAGWYMVKSGLVDDPHVSHLRLAVHLSLAFALFGLLQWTLHNRDKSVPAFPHFHRKPRRSILTFAFFLLCIQIVLGAFMAGLHAGLIYNTYPTMNGQWLPSGMFAMSPWWANMYSNITTVQFLHRWNAVLLIFFYLLWYFSERRYVVNPKLKRASALLVALFAVQTGLGVFTLLQQVPLHLAMLHQFVALLLFACMIRLLYGLSR